MSFRFVKDLSISTLQIVVNQVLGFIVFLLISFHLPKELYGELNWSFAIFTFINTLLTLRLDQVVVRRAAIEKDVSKTMTVYLFHVLLSGSAFYLLLLLASFIFPGFFSIHHLLLIVGVSQLLSYLASPFRQVANGKERFEYLAIMSTVNNLFRVIMLLILIKVSRFDIQSVLVIFILGSLIELLAGIFLVTRKMAIPVSRDVRLIDYRELLKASIHQVGSAILMAAITRIDWILLGLFSTSILTAEYTFAYRVYELSPLPLLIIAPVLLSRFSRYFSANEGRSLLGLKSELKFLIRMEMIAATLIPLLLNICWTPIMDYLTGDKYGSVNQMTFLILSVCIPFQYISNIIWSAHFAQNKLKLIFKITALTFLIVLTGDLICIPLFGVLGAAGVFLAAMIVEYLNYMRTSEIAGIRESWQSLIIDTMAAIAGGFTAMNIFSDTIAQLGTGLLIYFSLLLATSQLRLNDFVFMTQLIRNKKQGSRQ